MRDWANEAEKLDAQRLRADAKIKRQDSVVRRMNGSAGEHPEERHLLDEMRQNKAAIDFNRALLDYEKESDGDKPR